MAVGKQLVSLAVLVAVVISSLPPAAAALAQVQTSTPANDSTKVREFIEAVSSVVSRLKDMGVNVSKAEGLLAQALEALEAGNPGRARSLALLALITAGAKARDLAGAPRPVAAGLLMEIATLKRIVEDLNDAELKAKLEEAEKLLSRGIVNETVKILKEVREAVKKTRVEFSKSVREKARAEVEATVRARVREEKVMSELVKVLRKAENLSEIGKALMTVRVCEKLRERFNATVEDIDKALANVSEQSLSLLWDEIGESLEELKALIPSPLGLFLDIKAKVIFIQKLEEKLPEDLKKMAYDLVQALLKLNESVYKLIRCEEGYEELLREAKELSQKVVNSLTTALPPRGPSGPGKETPVSSVMQLYAVAKWVLTMADVLPRIVVCPLVGSEVVFKGVVLSTEGQVVAFGIMKSTVPISIEPVRVGNLVMHYPKRVAVRIGIFILDLSKVKEEVKLSSGDMVSCLGVYLGYRSQSKYPVIEVQQIKKLFQVEEIMVGD